VNFAGDLPAENAAGMAPALGITGAGEEETDKGLHVKGWGKT